MSGGRACSTGCAPPYFFARIIGLSKEATADVPSVYQVLEVCRICSQLVLPNVRILLDPLPILTRKNDLCTLGVGE